MQKKNKIIGIISSAFDFCTPGHLNLITSAKSNCDFLILALNTNPTISNPDTKQMPTESVFERWVRLQSISCVDLIIPYNTEEDYLNLLNFIKPNKRFLGSEYKNKKHVGSNIINIQKIYLTKTTHSSTKLRKIINYL